MTSETASRTAGSWVEIAESKGHKLRRNDDGDIDHFVTDVDFHNGPGCETCGDAWCEHCTDPAKIEPCDGGVELAKIKARARIRDASPDLLKAAKRALSTFRAQGVHRDGNNVVAALEDAIALATQPKGA